MGSYPTQGTDVCTRLYVVYFVAWKDAMRGPNLSSKQLNQMSKTTHVLKRNSELDLAIKPTIHKNL